MAFLWPESDAERASNSLRQTLFWLRRELDQDLFLPENTGGIGLDRSRLQIDLWTFRDAIERKRYRDAAAVYEGPFLDGFTIPGCPEFLQLLETERGRLERQYLVAIDTLAEQATADGRHDDAVAWRFRRVAADRFSSRSALALLRALSAAGDRTGALKYAAVYETMVRAHLETEPDSSVMDFVDELRSRTAGSIERTADPDRPAAAETRTDSLQPSTAAGPAAAGPRLAGRRIQPWHLAAAAVIGLAAITSVVRRAPPSAAASTTTTILASGASVVAGRDTANRLVLCSGPACPEGPLPQSAFAILRHIYYAPPVAGTGYIAPVANAREGPGGPKGYPCCTTAVFEHEFTLPGEAASAHILITLLADNQAGVAINGVGFGRQPDRLEAANYAGPAATFSTTFRPDPGGTNRLRITLWDGGGALGVQYHGIVTWEARDDWK